MISLGRKTDTVGIIEVGLVIFIQSREDDKPCSIIVAILSFQSAKNIMDRPASSNVKLLAVISDLTLTKVSGIDFPQLIETFFAHGNLNAGHKVITIEQSGGTI